MSMVELDNDPHRYEDPEHRIFSLTGFASFLACTILLLMATLSPSVLDDSQVNGYVSFPGLVSHTNVPIHEPVPAARRKARYHRGLGDHELEQAVRGAAQQHHVPPALLLAVMKAESAFNPTVVSKAGAVGLMQLIPETAIRHGVRNLYDANDNIAGGAKHLRYLLDRFHGNIQLALAAYNAGERKVDRYGQIPPYKETQDYVKKVLVYYRSYRKDGWITPVMTTPPSLHAGRSY